MLYSQSNTRQSLHINTTRHTICRETAEGVDQPIMSARDLLYHLNAHIHIRGVFHQPPNNKDKQKNILTLLKRNLQDPHYRQETLVNVLDAKKLPGYSRVKSHNKTLPLLMSFLQGSFINLQDINKMCNTYAVESLCNKLHYYIIIKASPKKAKVEEVEDLGNINFTSCFQVFYSLSLATLSRSHIFNKVLMSWNHPKYN